jgi:hypothetical protein
MRRRRRARTNPREATNPDLDRALEAMTAPELRSFVRTVFGVLHDDQRTTITDSLVARATHGDAGWKPSRPSARVIDEVRMFADAARRVAYADPDDVSDYLRQGTRAFLAGDHASARAVFETLLLPVAQGDINLGQHEMVDEVLNVDLHVTVAQYVTSVYTTTPLSGRANAVYSAITRVEGVATLANPIGDMESVSAGALPDLGQFLPQWVKRLERAWPAKDDWDAAPERWLREAVFRMEGVEGLERIARKTKRPQACLAWCEALSERGDWQAALRAYDDAAKLVGKSPWRGDLLDGAALAAQQLGRSDVAARLEAAWVAAPSLVRLLRWLVAPGLPSLTLITKAKRALKRCPKTDGRQSGFLRVLASDLGGGAKLLMEAPGLGWSSADHPGHLLFPVFAILLAEPGSQPIGPSLLTNLESTCRDPLEMLSRNGIEPRPALAIPSVGALIEDVHAARAIDASDRDAMLDAMRVAAEKRVEGILGQSRRHHYGHAATLVASCLAVAPKHRQKAASDRIDQLLVAHSRRHAFKEELQAALKSVGLTVPFRSA